MHLLGCPMAGFLLDRKSILTPEDVYNRKEKNKGSASSICKMCFSVTKSCATSPRQLSTYCLPQWGKTSLMRSLKNDNSFPKAQNWNSSSSSSAAWTRMLVTIRAFRGRKGELTAKNLGPMGAGGTVQRLLLETSFSQPALCVLAASSGFWRYSRNSSVCLIADIQIRSLSEREGRGEDRLLPQWSEAEALLHAFWDRHSKVPGQVICCPWDQTIFDSDSFVFWDRACGH